MLIRKKAVFSQDNGWAECVNCKDFKQYEVSALRENFRRLDESSDDLFYQTPRFVEHIDSTAVAALTEFHGRQLESLAKEFSNERSSFYVILHFIYKLFVPLATYFNHFLFNSFVILSELSHHCLLFRLQILDLCSSWVSHIPITAPVGMVFGLGMNAEELQRNSILSERVVSNLNDPQVKGSLPYQSNSFHAVLLQLSM
jgi:hypothetical protein